MVEITREEAIEIREAIPSAFITKTCKTHKSGKRGKYYISEGVPEMNMLAKLRRSFGIVKKSSE